MKNSQIALVLVGLMFLMSLGTFGLLIWYNTSTHKYTELNTRIEMWRNTDNFMQRLLMLVAEYSKKDPGIKPLVDWATNSAANTPPPSLPGTK